MLFQSLCCPEFRNCFWFPCTLISTVGWHGGQAVLVLSTKVHEGSMFAQDTIAGNPEVNPRSLAPGDSLRAFLPINWQNVSPKAGGPLNGVIWHLFLLDRITSNILMPDTHKNRFFSPTTANDRVSQTTARRRNDLRN